MKLGCNPEVRNRRNKTCAELIADTSVWETLISYVHHRQPLSPCTVAEKKTSYTDSNVTPTETKDESTDSAAQIVSASISITECIVCCESLPTVRFEPCGHTVACFECAQRMKKCLECHVVIVSKSNSGQLLKSISPSSTIAYDTVTLNSNFQSLDGTSISSPSSQPSGDRLKYLESRIAEIEESYTCSICMERRRNVAFLCGHGACDNCSQTLRTCHMCRKLIARKINLY